MLFSRPGGLGLQAVQDHLFGGLGLDTCGLGVGLEATDRDLRPRLEE